jgi:hypothetical protein
MLRIRFYLTRLQLNSGVRQRRILSHVPMNRFRHLSLSRALVLAVAWPALLILLSSIALGVGRGYQWWVQRQGDATQTFFFRVRILSWPRTLLVLLGPSLVVLALWTLLQIGRSDPLPNER